MNDFPIVISDMKVGGHEDDAFRVSINGFDKGDLLGKGRFGYLYRCCDHRTKIIFVIKEVMFTLNEKTKEEIKNLEDLMGIYCKWKSPRRILRYYGTTVNDKQMNIYMEYMPVGSIRDKLNKSGPFVSKAVSRYTRQILEGLDFLHQNGIIHRDVRGKNVMLDVYDNIKLRNFGFTESMRTLGPLSPLSPQCTNINGTKNMIIDNTNWLAPEVLLDQNHSFKEDVWSLGVTVVEMLTGNPIYPELKLFLFLTKIASDSKVEYVSQQPIPEQLQLIIEEMLVKDHVKRVDVKTLLKNLFVCEA